MKKRIYYWVIGTASLFLVVLSLAPVFYKSLKILLILLYLLFSYIPISILFILLFREKKINIERKWSSLNHSYNHLQKEIKEEKFHSEQKSNFLSAISHEIATPLNSLSASLSLIFDGSLGKTNENQKEFLAIAQQSTARLSRLIDDLLDISCIEAGVIRITPRPLNIGVLGRGVVKMMLPSAQKKGIKLSSRIPFDLPPVTADHDRTIQILTNLISNGIKHTTPKGKIEVTAEERDDFLEVAVVDTGIGIPAEERERIFDRFYQIGQYHNNGFPGRGLGLSIIKLIAERQGGKIWVESEVGKGSKFTFTLPKLYPFSFQSILDEAIRFGQKEGETFILFLLKTENLLNKEEGFKRELELLLKETMRHSIDFIGRDKDKIGVIIWNLPEEKINPFSARLEKTIREYRFSQFPSSPELVLRIGWVYFPKEARSREVLLKKAEKQLENKVRNAPFYPPPPEGNQKIEKRILLKKK